MRNAAVEDHTRKHLDAAGLAAWRAFYFGVMGSLPTEDWRPPHWKRA